MGWFNRLFSKADSAGPTARAMFVAEHEKRDEPWAMFEIKEFPDDGRIKVEFNWNDAFIERIRSLGFHAETEEDSVQLFFYTSQMKPTSLTMLDGDDSVQSTEHPELKTRVNRVAR